MLPWVIGTLLTVFTSSVWCSPACGGRSQDGNLVVCANGVESLIPPAMTVPAHEHASDTTSSFGLPWWSWFAIIPGMLLLLIIMLCICCKILITCFNRINPF